MTQTTNAVKTEMEMKWVRAKGTEKWERLTQEQITELTTGGMEMEFFTPKEGKKAATVTTAKILPMGERTVLTTTLENEMFLPVIDKIQKNRDTIKRLQEENDCLVKAMDLMKKAMKK